MMKKLLLLLASGSFAVTAMAQTAVNSVVHTGKARKAYATEDVVNPANLRNYRNSNAANKGTVTPGPRWYNVYEYYYESLGGSAGTMSNTIVPIWFDSSILVKYSNNPSPSTINFSAVSQVFDPASNSNIFNSSLLNPGELAVQRTLPYKVDSVHIAGAYARMASRPAGIVDTLVISVAPNTFTYYRLASTYPAAANYLPAGKDTLWGPAPTSVDSATRTAKTDVAANPGVSWKVPLTAAMGTTFTGSYTLQDFNFAVPGGGVTIPAGARVSVTYAFKSGDIWTRNVDTVQKFNRFYPLFGESADGTRMPNHWYDFGDRNGSGLFFSTDNGFDPSMYIESYNTIDFSYEYLYNSIKVSCQGCPAVGVGNVNNIKMGNVYPNPAVNSVTLPFSVKESANVNVVLTSVVGQTIASQNFGTVNAGVSKNATFSTAGIANGVYFMTVEANGARSTSRFVVNH